MTCSEFSALSGLFASLFLAIPALRFSNFLKNIKNLKTNKKPDDSENDPSGILISKMNGQTISWNRWNHWMLIAGFILLGLSFLVSVLKPATLCESTSDDQYATNNVTIESAVLKGNSIELTYRTILETMYYSPGIQIEMDNHDMIVYVMRCSIGTDCKVDKKATLKDGSSHVTFEQPKGIVFLGKDKSRKIDIN